MSNSTNAATNAELERLSREFFRAVSFELGKVPPDGLVREYLPKGTDLSLHSHQALATNEAVLNHRPRKILGYRTPPEVFSNLMLHQVQGVALQA